MTTFKSFSLKHKQWYSAIFIIAFSIALAIFSIIENKLNIIVISSATAVSAGFTHFLYIQHNHNTKIFIELFKDFNKRYNSLNENLNEILSSIDPLSTEQNQTLYDYFNLCAEEYLFYKSGFIDENVWNSWRSGMKIFLKDERISEIWKKEIENNSYYGFEI